MREAFRYLIGIAGPSGFGSNSTAEEVVEGVACAPTLTAIITGATSGIGAETARVLAKKGLRLVLPARDLKRATEVRERIQRESPHSEIIVLEMDLSSFTSIQRFCSQFLSLGLPLNTLIDDDHYGRECTSALYVEGLVLDVVGLLFMDSVLKPLGSPMQK
ncbi:hypothetical protein Taro_021110 [Colocasia esculenta]|uniref:Uncharacterized protein n=1 Tax=Colocasia esculenta TaxID=4460 RepID=A0A843V433_COLES|nr:hypothetical protein [Colocasia esculenta]